MTTVPSTPLEDKIHAYRVMKGRREEMRVALQAIEEHVNCLEKELRDMCPHVFDPAKGRRCNWPYPHIAQTCETCGIYFGMKDAH